MRLPAALTSNWNWQRAGACYARNPEDFFHPEGERGSARVNRASAAKAICSSCPVLDLCRSHALAVREPYGIWGGLTEEERHAVLAGRLALPAAS